VSERSAIGVREDKNGRMDLLYKYRPFDSALREESERTLRMLRESNVWMATPSSFNDPFDCQPSILRNRETEQRNLARITRNYLSRIKKALRTGSILADRQTQPMAHRTLVNLRRSLESKQPNERKYQALKKHFLVPPDAEAAFGLLQARLARVGVLSLSANPTEMLMWAHYASQHAGFCLGFERSEGSLLKSDTNTKPVRYGDEFPELGLDTSELSWLVTAEDGSISDSIAIDIEEPHLQTVIYSKSTKWQHEQEWRVLVREGGVLSGYPGPLRRVIFGLRCGRDARQLVEETVREASHKDAIQFAEIQSRPGSFDLGIREL
jgi:hypothetical protein